MAHISTAKCPTYGIIEKRNQSALWLALLICAARGGNNIDASGINVHRRPMADDNIGSKWLAIMRGSAWHRRASWWRGSAEIMAVGATLPKPIG